LSLESSLWSLPQIVSILEGGNKNFINGLNKVEQEVQKKFSFRNLFNENVPDATHFHSFEYRYKHDIKAKKYKKLLSEKVTIVCKAHRGNEAQNQSTSIIDEKSINEGASLATFMVQKSRRGNLTKTLTSRFLCQSDKGPLHTPKMPKRSSSSLSFFQQKKNGLTIRPSNDIILPINQSKAVSVFFDRICDNGIASTRELSRNYVKYDKDFIKEK
jgi:hypothetical protein